MKTQLRLLVLIAACSVSAASSLPQTVQKLTLQEAEQTAIQNHPRIQAAMHLASAAKAQVTQARSAYYPTIYASLTGADAQSGSDGGAALGGDSGPLEARADNGVLGRTQQSVLGNQTKGARLS